MLKLSSAPSVALPDGDGGSFISPLLTVLLKDAPHCKGNELTTWYCFPASMFLVTSSSKSSPSLLLKSFWWRLCHEQTHSGDSLSFRKHWLIPSVLASSDLKFRVCWEDPCRHCGNPFKNLLLSRHDAQDVSLEITLSSYLNKRKLQQDFFHIWKHLVLSLSIVLTLAAFATFSSLRMKHWKKQTDMFCLSGGTEE